MERHDLDPISLVFGLAFTTLGLLFLAGPVSLGTWHWALPLLAIGLGLATLLSTRRTSDQVDSRRGGGHESAHVED
jgi:hypothetical protein